MRSGFLNSPPNSSASSLGPLRDPRSNTVQLPVWGRRSSSSSSTDGPTGHRGGWGNISTNNVANRSSWTESATKQKQQQTTWTATTTTTSTDTPIPTKKQKQTTTNPTPPPPTPPIPNPLKNVPLLPHKTIGVPKNALNAWYGKRHKGIPLSNSCFTTWSDGGMPHILKFTSVFTCPVTGERFRSGRYGDAKYYSVVKEEEGSGVDVVWYSKKMMAEHGAAARALDCLALRENKGKLNLSYCICIERPYMTPGDAPPLPHHCPVSLKDTVVAMEVTKDTEEKEKEQGGQDTAMMEEKGGMGQVEERSLIGQMEDAEEECEEEFDKLRNEYREMRKTGYGVPCIAAGGSAVGGVLNADESERNTAGTATVENTAASLPPFSRLTTTELQSATHPLQCGPDEAKAWLGTDLVSAMDADDDDDDDDKNKGVEHQEMKICKSSPGEI